MSVQRNGYVITGMKFEYDVELSEHLYEAGYCDSAFKKDYPEILALCDNMSGEYIIVGKCHEKTGNWHELECDTNLTIDDEQTVEEINIEVTDEIVDLIEKLYNITGRYAQVNRYVVYHYR